jgi:hypothetical protein
MRTGEVCTLSHLQLLGTLLCYDDFSLLFDHAVLHVLLEQVDRIDLCDYLNLHIESFIAELVPSDGFLNQWYVRREVYGQLLGYVGYQVQDLSDIMNLRDVSLHDLKELVNNLSHVFAEGLAILQGIDGLKHLNVQFDLIV